MRYSFRSSAWLSLNRFGHWLVMLFTASSLSSQACTVFTLTDADGTLFCNNEDWEDPSTRIWFVPNSGELGKSKRYGCAYVGFGDNWAQGGVNTEGVAFDWVSGYKERWERDSKMKIVEGNPAERMLESCATVEEAIAFFASHWESSFAYGRILVADRTGASANIGASEGKLDVKRTAQPSGFGYGHEVLERMFAETVAPTMANAARILKATRQQGRYATKYSNVFDLRSGDIFLIEFLDEPVFVKLRLAEELKKGGHFYELQKLLADSRKRPK